MARARAIVGHMCPHNAFTGTPYITAKEIAHRLGIRETSVRTLMGSMRRRKTDPVDWRVPRHELPDDIGRRATLYWRADVEPWLTWRAGKTRDKDTRP